MLYLNEKHIRQTGINWDESINAIMEAISCLKENDYSQPIKPYLRFRDLNNRIIAMPAFVGKKFDMAGIKWIASFPKNIEKNIPRAHSVVILNNSTTGEIDAIINTSLLSIIRTVSVSGLMLKQFDKIKPLRNFNLGIIGWGPIGQHHFNMVTKILGDKISKIYLYDLREINKNSINLSLRDKVIIAKNWEEAYYNADVFITCTTSKNRYIDKKPKKGSLILNISLRDFKTDIYDHVKKNIIVDDWNEVCRENTDIEMFHIEKGLEKKDTINITDIIYDNFSKKICLDETIMFNPMGMAVFDIATAVHYFKKAKEKKVGQILT
ncbi:MAG: 2,3-diaminopropionate biosynthesis protein SbnB [bacterium]